MGRAPGVARPEQVIVEPRPVLRRHRRQRPVSVARSPPRSTTWSRARRESRPDGGRRLEVGGALQRVVIAGERFVLKHVDHRDDWIMRQTGDVGCIPVRVWESGVLDLLPDCLDHATVGAAREAGHGAVLMRDVGRWLVPAGEAPVSEEQHLRSLDHLAALDTAASGAGTTTSA